MTTDEPRRESGYRGALPPREDRLARPWIVTVIGIFVLVLLLSIVGVPSRFIPEETPLPVPSPSASSSASASAEASGSASPSASPSASAEPSPTSE